MICTACQSDNAPARHFCRDCGVSLIAVCHTCAFVNEAADHYCGGCGQSLRKGAAKPAEKIAVASVHRAPAVVATGSAVSAEELRDLLRMPAAAPTVQTLPARVSQDELDRLFGGGQ